ncbi:hypothetical protein ACQKMD_09230 [Viridibacillus sp. NPDC096237]
MDNGKVGDKQHLRSIMTRQKLLELQRKFFLKKVFMLRLFLK